MGHTCAKDEIKQAQRAAIWKSGPKGPETSSILTYIRWKQVKIQIYFTSVRHICKYTAMPRCASSRALCGNICVPFLPLWWNGRSKPNVVWDSLHKYVVSKHIPRCSFRTSKCILSTPSQLRCSLKTPFEAQMLFSEHPPNSDVVQKHLPSSDVVQKHPPSSDMVWKHTRTTDVVWKHPLSSDMGQTPGQMSSLPCSGVGSVFPGAPAWRIVAGFSRHISPDLGQASPLAPDLTAHQISIQHHLFHSQPSPRHSYPPHLQSTMSPSGLCGWSRCRWATMINIPRIDKLP